MFDTLNDRKKNESEALLRSLDPRTKEELLELLNEIIKRNETRMTKQERIRVLEKDLERHSFNTDYW